MGKAKVGGIVSFGCASTGHCRGSAGFLLRFYLGFAPAGAEGAEEGQALLLEFSQGWKRPLRSWGQPGATSASLLAPGGSWPPQCRSGSWVGISQGGIVALSPGDCPAAALAQ